MSNDFDYNRESDSLEAPPEFIIKNLIKQNRNLIAENERLSELVKFYETRNAGELRKMKQNNQNVKWWNDYQKAKKRIQKLKKENENLIIKLATK